MAESTPVEDNEPGKLTNAQRLVESVQELRKDYLKMKSCTQASILHRKHNLAITRAFVAERPYFLHLKANRTNSQPNRSQDQMFSPGE